MTRVTRPVDLLMRHELDQKVDLFVLEFSFELVRSFMVTLPPHCRHR